MKYLLVTLLALFALTSCGSSNFTAPISLLEESEEIDFTPAAFTPDGSSGVRPAATNFNTPDLKIRVSLSTKPTTSNYPQWNITTSARATWSGSSELRGRLRVVLPYNSEPSTEINDRVEKNIVTNAVRQSIKSYNLNRTATLKAWYTRNIPCVWLEYDLSDGVYTFKSPAPIQFCKGKSADLFGYVGNVNYSGDLNKPQPHQTGTTQTYAIHYVNGGSGVAQGIKLTATIPDSLEYLGNIQAGYLESDSDYACTFTAPTLTCLYNQGLGFNRWNYVQFDLRAKPNASGTRLITSTVSTTSREVITANNSRSNQIQIMDSLPDSDLRVSATYSRTALRVGETTTATVTVTNAGTQPSLDRILRLQSDGYTLYYFTLLSASSGCKREIQPGWGGFDEWRCALEPIFPGQTRTYTATLRANTAGAYPYTMRVSSGAGDRATQPSSATTISVTTPPPPPPPPPPAPPDRPATPPNFAATVTEGNRVMLTWSVAARATSYRLEYREITNHQTAPYSLLTNFNTANANSYDANYVNFPAVYEYRLTAINSSGESDPTLVSATTSAYSAPPPTLTVTLEDAPQIVTVGQAFEIKVRVTNPLTNDNSADHFNLCFNTNGDLNTQSATLTTPDGATVGIDGASRCVNLADEVSLQRGESLLVTWSVIADYVSSPKSLAANANARVNNLSGWAYGTGDAPETTFQIVPVVYGAPALALSFETGYTAEPYGGQTVYIAVVVVNSGSSTALGTEVCLSTDQDVSIAESAFAFTENGGNYNVEFVGGCVVFDATIGTSTVQFTVTANSNSSSSGTISAALYHPSDSTPDDNNTNNFFWVHNP